MKRQLPKYVYRITGKLYFRRGSKDTATPMDNDFGTPAFWAEYALRLRGTPPAPKGKTFSALIASYERSDRFTSLAPRTKADYVKVLGRIDKALGPLNPAKMERKDVLRLQATNAATTRLANYLVQVMVPLLEHARDIGWVGNDYQNPARGVKMLKSGLPPRKPWPADKVDAMRDAYPFGTRERTLFELLIGTGQRIGDVLRMQWGHIDGDGIKVRQNKTGKDLWVPLTDDLRQALAATDRRNLTILTRFDGRKPWAYRGAADAMMAARTAIGAEAYDIHALRHTAASEMARAGCSDELIAAACGMSMATVARYTATVRQKVRALKVQETRR